jgi:hypothetical protein
LSTQHSSNLHSRDGEDQKGGKADKKEQQKPHTLTYTQTHKKRQTEKEAGERSEEQKSRLKKQQRKKIHVSFAAVCAGDTCSGMQTTFLSRMFVTFFFSNRVRLPLTSIESAFVKERGACMAGHVTLRSSDLQRGQHCSHMAC